MTGGGLVLLFLCLFVCVWEKSARKATCLDFHKPLCLLHDLKTSLSFHPDTSHPSGTVGKLATRGWNQRSPGENYQGEDCFSNPQNWLQKPGFLYITVKSFNRSLYDFTGGLGKGLRIDIEALKDIITQSHSALYNQFPEAPPRTCGCTRRHEAVR